MLSRYFKGPKWSSWISTVKEVYCWGVVEISCFIDRQRLTDDAIFKTAGRQETLITQEAAVYSSHCSTTEGWKPLTFSAERPTSGEIALTFFFLSQLLWNPLRGPEKLSEKVKSFLMKNSQSIIFPRCPPEKHVRCSTHNNSAWCCRAVSGGGYCSLQLVMVYLVCLNGVSVEQELCSDCSLN